MLKLIDGRDHLYQWDTNRMLSVSDETVEIVEFQLISSSEILPVEVKYGMVEVPNILLQSGKDIIAYSSCISDGQLTKLYTVFSVRKRQKPSDYVYTETEIKRYDDLEKRIEKIEQNGGGGGASIAVDSELS